MMKKNSMNSAYFPCVCISVMKKLKSSFDCICSTRRRFPLNSTNMRSTYPRFRDVYLMIMGTTFLSTVSWLR